MKSLKSFKIIAMIIGMGVTTSVFAQVPETQDDDLGTQDPMEQHQQTMPEHEMDSVYHENDALPQEQNQLGDDIDFSEEIEETELPAVITASLDETYPNHEVEKVFKGSDNSYKIKLKDGEAKSVVFYNESGTFLKEEKDEDCDK